LHFWDNPLWLLGLHRGGEETNENQ
jgi:hypothetical protein